MSLNIVGVRNNPSIDTTIAAERNIVIAVFAALLRTSLLSCATYLAISTLTPTPKPETAISITFTTGPLTETPVICAVPRNFPVKYISTAL